MDAPPAYTPYAPSAPPLADIDNVPIHHHHAPSSASGDFGWRDNVPIHHHHAPSPAFSEGWVRPLAPPGHPSITVEALRKMLVEYLRSSWLGHNTISNALADFYLDFTPARHLDIIVFTPLTAVLAGSLSLKETRELVKEQVPNSEKERNKLGLLGGSQASNLQRNMGRDAERWGKGLTTENANHLKSFPVDHGELKTWQCPTSVNVGSRHLGEKWRSGQVISTVPNTTTFQLCVTCTGNGYVPCHACHSSGKKRVCEKCGGEGFFKKQQVSVGSKTMPCPSCDGKPKSCSDCDGTGRKMCDVCKRSGSTIDRYVVKMTRLVDVSVSVFIKRKDPSTGVFRTVSLPDLSDAQVKASNHIFKLWSAEAGIETIDDDDDDPILLPDLDPRDTLVDFSDVMESVTSKLSATKPSSSFNVVSTTKMTRNVAQRLWMMQGVFHRIECTHGDRTFYLLLAEDASASRHGQASYRVVHVSGYPSGQAYLKFGLTVAGAASVIATAAYFVVSSFT